MGELTPMMQQYVKTKEEYKDCILFYRLGDFYEMFFDDAVLASRELELTLTGKSCGLEERAPMCGVPFHSVDPYINKLVKRGYKVAICEQVEDPKQAKGLVKRDVTRIITPGTNIDTMSLDSSTNNYIICVYPLKNKFGIASCDVSTADFYITDVDSLEKLNDEIFKFNPAEIILHDSMADIGFDYSLLKTRIENISITTVDNSLFDNTISVRTLLNHFKVHSLEALGILDFKAGQVAAGALLLYLYDTQKSDLSHITSIKPYTNDSYMLLDQSSRRNLELTETIRGGAKKGSLLWVLDKTKTAMGARLLKSYVEQPLINVEEIIRRQDAIEEINKSIINREEIREYLSSVYDLERLVTKITYQSANPRDLIAFKQSISILPAIKTILKDYKVPLMAEIYEELDTLSDLYELIDASIMEEPSISLRDGDIIKAGYNEEIDKLRSAKIDGKSWLADLEAREKEATGIKNLKIKHNNVFGYYLEVTNSYKDLVPDYYIRKQTLANAERYYTQELKELEDIILGAEDRLNILEYEYFKLTRDTIAAEVERIQTTAKAIAKLDCFISLAVVAQRNHYVRPVINNRGVIDIKEGRHPVVELMIEDGQFITNDTYLDSDSKYISVITGPNMAGKSTYMRQTAIIVLMAQIGSFVPANSATIGICDRIFTRVGASDDLSTGQSTFMVEMNEVANILRNATSKSLLILDEIGRGTSTYDGLSIAWAVLDHISDKNKLGAKTLFATHYHELTELEGQLEGVNNYCIAVKENDDGIIFLRKIIKGGADQSYGIEVAKLAGLPDSVITKAKAIVTTLNESDITSVNNKLKDNEIALATSTNSLSISNNDIEIINDIKALDVTKLTPIEAMNILYNLHEKVDHD